MRAGPSVLCATCALLVGGVVGCTPGAGSTERPDSWPSDNAAKESDMLSLVNDVRAAGATCPQSGAQPATGALADDEDLRWAARLHARDMGERGYFEHDTPEGDDPFERMASQGYDGDPRAENIAAGNETAQATLDQWLASDGHCVNIMIDARDELGVGVAFFDGSPYGWYCVQNFGSR
jgi:uncharacterized protein YkwD